MQSIIHKLLRNPYQLFLVDGLGAFLSASLLLLVVAPLEKLFGMPSTIVIVLGIIACVLMIISISCFLLKPERWTFWISVVATADFLYACTIAVLMFVYLDELRIPGFIYFIGEIIVLCIIIMAEQKIVNEANKNTKSNPNSL